MASWRNLCSIHSNTLLLTVVAVCLMEVGYSIVIPDTSSHKSALSREGFKGIRGKEEALKHEQVHELHAYLRRRADLASDHRLQQLIAEGEINFLGRGGLSENGLFTEALSKYVKGPSDSLAKSVTLSRWKKETEETNDGNVDNSQWLLRSMHGLSREVASMTGLIAHAVVGNNAHRLAKDEMRQLPTHHYSLGAEKEEERERGLDEVGSDDDLSLMDHILHPFKKFTRSLHVASVLSERLGEYSISHLEGSESEHARRYKQLSGKILDSSPYDGMEGMQVYSNMRADSEMGRVNPASLLASDDGVASSKMKDEKVLKDIVNGDEMMFELRNKKGVKAVSRALRDALGANGAASAFSDYLKHRLGSTQESSEIQRERAINDEVELESALKCNGVGIIIWLNETGDAEDNIDDSDETDGTDSDFESDTRVRNVQRQTSEIDAGGDDDERGYICVCPIDYHGKDCESIRIFKCSFQLVSPTADCISETQYGIGFDGIPVCYLYDSNVTQKETFTYSMQCSFMDTPESHADTFYTIPPEYSDETDQLFLDETMFNYTVFVRDEDKNDSDDSDSSGGSDAQDPGGVTFPTFGEEQESEVQRVKFAISASRNLTLQAMLKPFNFNRFGDLDAAQMKDLSPTEIAGVETFQFTVDFKALIAMQEASPATLDRNTYFFGGRLYIETGLYSQEERGINTVKGLRRNIRACTTIDFSDMDVERTDVDYLRLGWERYIVLYIIIGACLLLLVGYFCGYVYRACKAHSKKE